MLFKKQFLTFFVVSSFSVSSFAGEVQVSEVITDQYWGADEHVGDRTTDGGVMGGGNYNTHSLYAEKVTDNGQTFLNVYVDTNFSISVANSGIEYGDLFITTSDNYSPSYHKDDITFHGQPSDPSYGRQEDLGSATRWDYAFDIDDGHADDGGWGKLVEIPSGSNFSGGVSNANWGERAYANSLQTAKEFNDDRDGRNNQVVKVFDSTGTVDDAGYKKTSEGGNYIALANGSSSNYWETDIGGGSNGTSNRLTFSFEITGIDALVDADQLAFRWAMTCANDIVEGVAQFTKKVGKTDIPEPTTIALFLMALAFLVSRTKKNLMNEEKFEA